LNAGCSGDDPPLSPEVAGSVSSSPILRTSGDSRRSSPSLLLCVGTDLLKLLAWTGAIVALLLLPVSRKLEREREGPAVARPFRPAAPRLAKQP
jgi:hypothetical protein